MIYFCADDYGISEGADSCIKNCVEYGVLNKISVLPNSRATDFKQKFSAKEVMVSLHINLVEGKTLSNKEDIDLLVTEDGNFKHSFIGLLYLSLSSKKKELEKQIYKEIQSQIRYWKKEMGEDIAFSIDSHQHTHMIPLIFKTLMKVVRDEGIKVSYLRIPNEPLSPYLLTPSLYFEYSPVGLLKQWLLKLFAAINRSEFKKSKIQSAYFMGVLFSGKLNEVKIKKILPKYLKIAKKKNKDIEIGFHPGVIKDEEDLLGGIRYDFKKFYASLWRKIEHDTLINLNIK